MKEVTMYTLDRRDILESFKTRHAAYTPISRKVVAWTVKW